MRLVALYLIHLHRQPPTERARVASPLALNIYRYHVIDANQLRQYIGSDVVLVGVHEVHFTTETKLHVGLVFINLLERSVVGHGSVTQGKPHGVGDALLRPLTAHHLGGKKELLNLVLAEGWLVGGKHNGPAS